MDHGKIFCVRCGLQGLADEPSMDVRTLLDTADMRSRRTDTRSIVNELLEMNFRRSVCEMANNIFLEITDGQTYRCKSRQALIWVCVFSALKSHGLADYQILQNQMKIRNKKMMQGLKRLAFQKRKDSPSTKNKTKHKNPQTATVQRGYSISATKIAKTIMQKFNATEQHIGEVRVLLRAVSGQSATLARSRPQSLAAAMVYSWIKVTKQNISMEEFRAQVELSPATIQRVSDKIASVLESVIIADNKLTAELSACLGHDV
jgi:hypothetical protein